MPVCERNPEEAIKTNIQGTLNAVEVALERAVATFVLVSTDKAVDPINVYGVSKSMAEKVVSNANLREGATRFVCIRGGNVLGTQGSVVPLFREQIIRANEITITDRRMTRYLMRLTDAIALIFKATTDAKGGEVFVMKMPSVRITDLAEVMISRLGDGDTRVREIGIRPGEKLHKSLVFTPKSTRAFDYGDYYVILPPMDINGVHSKWQPPSYLDSEYESSDNRFLSTGEIERTLEVEGWFARQSSADLQQLSSQFAGEVQTRGLEPVTRILVLGTSGMLGSMVLDRLQRNPDFDVRGTVRYPDRAPANAVGPLHLDVAVDAPVRSRRFSSAFLLTSSSIA